MVCTLKSSYLLSLLTSPTKGCAGDAFLPLPQLGRPKILFPMLQLLAEEKNKKVDCPFMLPLYLLLEGEGCAKQCRRKWVGNKTENAVL